MIRYKLRPVPVTGDKEIKYKDLYIAPDLSYISGITEYTPDLHDGDFVFLQNMRDGESNIFSDAEDVTISLEDVRIQGRVGVKMVLPVKTITKKLNLPIVYSSGTTPYIIVNNEEKYLTSEQIDSMSAYTGYLTSVTQNYVEYNGNISYFFNGDTKGYLINDKFYSAASSDTTVTIDDYLYIENGKITVGDLQYDVIFDENGQNPVVKLNKYADNVADGGTLGQIGENVCLLKSDNDILRYNSREYKFKIDNFYNNRNIGIEDVLRVGYRHYIEYKGEQLYLSFIYDSDGYQLGYGLMIDGTFYEATMFLYDDEYMSDNYYDYDSVMSYVKIDGEDYGISSTPRAVTDGGVNLFLITNSEILPIGIGTTLVAEGGFETSRIETVQYDEDETPYIIHKGKRYDVKDHEFDVIIILSNEYRLVYEDGDYTSAYIQYAADKRIYFTIDVNTKKATQVNDIYYSDTDNNDNLSVKYGKRQNAYDVVYYSGVTIGDSVYRVEEYRYEVENEDEEEEELYEPTEKYVEVSEKPVYELNVYDTMGSATYLCNPIIRDENLSNEELDNMARAIVDDIVLNQGNFTFKIKSIAFSGIEAVPEASLCDSMSTTIPMAISERTNAYKNIRITYRSLDLLVQFPMENRLPNNLLQGDVSSNIYAAKVKNGFINQTVDMEKDVYYPVYDATSYNGNTCSMAFRDIDEIRFNFHFRTRNLDNWKTLDDTTYDTNYTNWFITDYSIYKEVGVGLRKGYMINDRAKQNASDLVAFANFTTSEVRNMAKKISNSFLRMSLYSTNDPNTQILLSTSCMYLDERNLLNKYMQCKYASSLDFINTETYEMNSPGWLTSSTLANTELFEDPYLTDQYRLSTRITVNDKYRTDASSEGFYQYIYKEYSKGLKETVVYARFEFNHAGVGQSIPMMIPRKNIGEASETPLYLYNADDLKTLKEGFPMSDIYNQLYFPIHIKYDDNTNRFVYWIPNNLRENEELSVDDNIMEFNLFEIKFKDESFDDESN